METIDFTDFKFALEPDAVFWAIYDSEKELDKVRKMWERYGDELGRDMEKYRFEVNPDTAYINVTDLCNANCPYCYIPEDVRKNGRSMSKDELYDILSRLEGTVDWIIFHGSEPLMAKDRIFDAINDFNFNFNFGIQTNAKLLEEEDMDFLMENNVNVGISLDSPYEDTNDFLRGKGQFKAANKAIEHMSNYSRLNVITTINRYNYEHLEDMVEFLAGKVGLVLMNPVRGTSEGGREIRAEPVKAAESFIKACRKAIDLTKSGTRIVIGDFANIILGIIAPTSRVLQCDISPCGAGRRFFAIATDGIYPCGEFIGLKEFRVPAERLGGIVSEFESVRNRVVEKIEECNTCPYRHICGAPCPAEVYAENGTMYAKSPYCDFYKRVIEFAIETIYRGEQKFVINEKNLKVRYRVEG
jgi:uncharacterized protein